MDASSANQVSVNLLLDNYFVKYQAVKLEAENRLIGIRIPKLGDLHIQDDFYDSLIALFHDILENRNLRNFIFDTKNNGFKARSLLLVLMSEMVYREYERSFWDKFWEILEVQSGQLYSWTTDQMLKAYGENDIKLLRSGYFQRSRREYVRTIISESGFSQKLVRQAKSFVLWYFDRYSENDPRLVNYDSFEKILDEYGIESKDDAFELFREMIRLVGKLLREIRRRSLSVTDIERSEIIEELEIALGFHPIRGIFGFRNREDIIELIEELSHRIRPERFEYFLRKRTRDSKIEIEVETPSGENVRTKKISELLPVQYGEYKFPNETILVVPREAISYNQFLRMFSERHGRFHEDSDWVYIYDKDSFEINFSRRNSESPREYSFEGKSGYLWYGRQPIGVSISAERDGEVLDHFDPKVGLRINPRIRLDKKREGLIVSIPSFSLFNPKFAGQTVRIELNNKPIENTTYIVGNRGGLQFQGTRFAKVDLEEEQLVLRVATIKDSVTLAEKKIIGSLRTNLLFSKASRELISTGEKENGGKEFILFVGASDNLNFSIFDNIKIRSTRKAGTFSVYDLEWVSQAPTNNNEFHLKIDEYEWLFHSLLELYLKIDSHVQYIDFEPGPNAFFSLGDIDLKLIRIDQSVNRNDLSLWSILIEKDQEVIDNISLSEMDKQGWVRETSTKSITANLYEILNHYLAQHKVRFLEGTYNLTLMYQQKVGTDVEILHDIEFILLPMLYLNKLEKIYCEGTGEYATVTSDQPVLIDSEDRIGSAIQEFFRPEVEFNDNQNMLVPKLTKKTIRLSFPATKVTVGIKPDIVVAARIKRGTKTLRLDKLVIEYSDLEFSTLLLSFPSQMQPILECDDYSEKIRGERFPLGKLSGHINKRKVKVCIKFSDLYQRDFTIIRHIRFQFLEQKVSVVQDTEQIRTELYFQLDGPSDLPIQFNLTDNKLRAYGPYVYTLNALKNGRLTIDLPMIQLQDARLLYCSVLLDGESLGKITIPLMGVGEKTDENKIEQGIVHEVTQLLSTITQKQNCEKELINLLNSVRVFDDEECTRHVLRTMYTADRLEEIRNKIKNNDISQDLINDYFSMFSQEYFPEIHEELFIPTVKKFCTIEIPELLSICAEKLIERNDGVGIEVLIEDLMVTHKIDWEYAMKILKTNPELSAERIKEIVELEPIENRSFEYIDTFMFVGNEFYAPIVKIARAAKDWKRAKNFLKTKDVIGSSIVDVTRDGVIVPFGSIVGIVPWHQCDWRKHGLREDSKYSDFVKQKLQYANIQVVVTEANRQKGKLLFSEVDASTITTHIMLKKLTPGKKVNGIVTNITDYGAFVDIGGISGLIHLSEISWQRVSHPSHFLKVGTTVEVLILSVNIEQGKINLSLKRVSEAK